jgi:vacuolar-type H+-ATPase subunit H
VGNLTHRGGDVEKLERVLAVEEVARNSVAKAADEASAIRSAALEEARTLESDAAIASATAVKAQADSIMAVARAETDRLSAEADSARGAATETARKRLDSVVTGLAARFKE